MRSALLALAGLLAGLLLTLWLAPHDPAAPDYRTVKVVHAMPAPVIRCG